MAAAYAPSLAGSSAAGSSAAQQQPDKKAPPLSDSTPKKNPAKWPGGTPLIAICGAMGAGKDTFAEAALELFESRGGAVAVCRFAKPLRTVLEALTEGAVRAGDTYTPADKSRRLPAGSLGATLRELKARLRAAFAPLRAAKTPAMAAALADEVIVLRAAETLAGVKATAEKGEDTPFATPAITIGRALQLLGSEVGRDIFWADVWAHEAMAEVRACRAAGAAVIVPDLRMPNELALLKKEGAVPLRVTTARDVTKFGAGRSAKHESESGLPANTPLIQVANDGTIAEFRKTVKELLSYLIYSKNPWNFAASTGGKA